MTLCNIRLVTSSVTDLDLAGRTGLLLFYQRLEEISEKSSMMILKRKQN
jgi:hypothetical protein